MSQEHYTKKRESGKHLNRRDREMLEYLCDQNRGRKKSEKWSQKEIAKMLGWSESTLSRELKRGAVEQIEAKDYRSYTGYSAYVAQCSIEKKWANKGRGIKLEDDAILARTLEKMLVGEKVEGLEKLRYSPEAIVMHFDRVGWPICLINLAVFHNSMYLFRSSGKSSYLLIKHLNFVL